MNKEEYVTGGAVVNVTLTGNVPLCDTVFNTDTRKFTVVDNIRDGFYSLTHYHLDSDVRMHLRHFLIPVTMAYLEYKGQVDRYKVPVEYYHAPGMDRVQPNLIRGVVLSHVIYEETGVYLSGYDVSDALDDGVDRMRTVTLSDFTPYVKAVTVVFDELVKGVDA